MKNTVSTVESGGNWEKHPVRGSFGVCTALFNTDIGYIRAKSSQKDFSK